MYRSAMVRAGANIEPVDEFFEMLERGYSVEGALNKLPIAKATKKFVLSTWEIIKSDSLPAVAASFAIARENVIPDMFTQLVRTAHATHPEQLETYLQYLERHIQLDGEEHGKATLHMLNEVCHNSPQAWAEAKKGAEKALEARVKLWDGVLEVIRAPKVEQTQRSTPWKNLISGNA